MNPNDKFYNQDRKLLFIDDYSNQGRTEHSKVTRRMDCNTVFKNTAPIENRYKKDFCEFLNGSPEIDDLYLIWFNNMTSGRVNIYSAILKSYLKWCYENNIISTKAYTRHEFYVKRGNRDKNKPNKSPKSSIVKKQMVLARDNDFSKDFIFEDEDTFISYISELFEDERFAMPAAMAILFYYRFDFVSVREILKSDVNTEQQTVQGVKIDNSKAFQIIVNAIDVKQYTTVLRNKNGTSYTRVETYVESPYLLRPASRGAKELSGQISINYTYKMTYLEEEAMKTLRPDSPYRGILIRGSTIIRLKGFHEMKKDEKQYGTAYVKCKIKNDGYDSALTYYDYCVLSSKVRTI